MENKEAKSSPHHGVRILLRKTRRIAMKKLEIIIKPEKLEDLKEVLDSCENLIQYLEDIIVVCRN